MILERNRVWAALASAIPGAVSDLERMAANTTIDVEDGAILPAAYAVRSDGVAVVPVRGIVYEADPWLCWMLGLVAPSALARAVSAAAADSNVKAVVLDVDSPGGAITGVPEAAAAIRAANAAKPVVANVAGLAASAGYWFASQAGGIVTGRAAELGSIGVYLVMTDSSRAAENAGITVHVIASDELKGAGVRGSQITDAQLSAERETVLDMADIFKADVRGGRPAVKDEALVGRTFAAKRALDLGLVDMIGTLDDAASSALAMVGERAAKAAAEGEMRIPFFGSATKAANAAEEATMPEANTVAAAQPSQPEPAAEPVATDPQPDYQAMLADAQAKIEAGAVVLVDAQAKNEAEVKAHEATRRELEATKGELLTEIGNHLIDNAINDNHAIGLFYEAGDRSKPTVLGQKAFGNVAEFKALLALQPKPAALPTEPKGHADAEAVIYGGDAVVALADQLMKKNAKLTKSDALLQASKDLGVRIAQPNEKE